MAGSEPIFEIAPETFDRIQLRGIRRQEEEADIGGPAQGVGLVKGPIIEDEEMEVGRSGGGQLLQEELKERAAERGQLQKEALACRRFHRPIQVETLEPIGGREHGLPAPSGDPAAHDRQQATPRFILRPHSALGVARTAGLAPPVLELLG